MNSFIRMLSEGDLRSDGLANEVAYIVSEQPALFADLLEALESSDPSVRGHAADALEKVARVNPKGVSAFLPIILRSAQGDKVAMVRWHLAMVLGHLSVVSGSVAETTPVLLAMLKDDSTFVRSWAITSLCLIAKNYPEKNESIVQFIAPLTSDMSPVVSKRARIALKVLTDPDAPLPRTWIKSAHIQDG